MSLKMANWKKPTKEMKENISTCFKKMWKDPEYRKKMSQRKGFLGKTHTKESNEKNRISHLGRHHTKEAIRKISEANKGKNNSMFGKTHSEQAREKIRLSKLGKKAPKVSETRKRLFAEGNLKVNFKGKHHTEETKKRIGLNNHKLWEDPNSIYNSKEWRENHTIVSLKGLIKRPTSYEKKISELCIDNNLPFIYNGNGTFLIGYKNPDFINEKDKVAIEVYNDYFKIRDFGSCEEYEKQRGDYFAKRGWRTIFIRNNEINPENWKEICLNKIKESIR